MYIDIVPLSKIIVHDLNNIMDIQVEVLLQKENIEGAIHILEDLVEATENVKTPTFSRDLDTAIDVVNQTLTQLVNKFNTSGHKISKVSCIIQYYTYYK